MSGMHSTLTCPLPMSGQITAAALFRIIEKQTPSFIVDEVDTFLRNSPELRGLINGSHRRAGAFTLRCEGEENEVRAFSTFSPKLLCGIGKLVDTIADRAVSISLSRRGPALPPLPLWRDRDRDRIAVLQRKIARWIADHQGAVLQGRSNVQFPGTLNDRQCDCWEALLAIANAAGGLWPERAHAAAEALSHDDPDDQSAREILIHHVQDVIEAKGNPPAIHTADLVTDLVAIEGAPWSEWNKGRGLKASGLASLLRDFRIKPGQVKIGGANKRGYQLADIWTSPK